MTWNWDEMNKFFFCFSKYHYDGVSFEYRIKPRYWWFELTGTKELVSRKRIYLSLRKAIEWIKKQEQYE